MGTTRSRNRRRDPVRRALRATLDAATSALHAVVARAFAARIANDADVQRLRSLLKEGARAHVGSDDALRITAERMDAYRAEIIERMGGDPASDHAGRPGVSLALMRDDTAPLAGAGTALVVPDGPGDRATDQTADGPVGGPAGGGGHALSGPVRGGPVQTPWPLASVTSALDVTRAPRRATLAELDEATLADHARRAALVRHMEEGHSAREALRCLRMDVTRATIRWAQRAFARARATGALHDRRRDRRGPRMSARTVMTGEMEALVLHHWMSRPSISAAVVRSLVADTVADLTVAAAARGVTLGLRVPSGKTIAQFVRALPPAIRHAREHGVQRWLKDAAPKALYEPARWGNEYWQIDHTQLDLWVRVLVGVQWVLVRPWLTLVLDVDSGAIMGRAVTLHAPDAFTTAHALRNAILSKRRRGDDPLGVGALRGVPLILTPDHGADFEAHSVAISVKALGIALDFCPPHYPDMKAEIERMMRTVNEGLCARWVGYTRAGCVSEAAARKVVDQLLTNRQFVRELDAWIDEQNTTLPAGETETPLDRWLRSAQIVEKRERDLDILLLKADATRTVTNRGIRFTPPGAARGTYWAPELAYHWRREVTLRYNPDDLESVLVFASATNEFLCEAWLMDAPDARYGVEDIKRVRRELYHRLVGLRRDGRRALKERMRTYWEEAATEARDARRRSGAEWSEMRQAAEAVLAADRQLPPAAPTARTAVDALVDALRQPARRLPTPADVAGQVGAAAAAAAADVDALVDDLRRPARGALRRIGGPASGWEEGGR